MSFSLTEDIKTMAEFESQPRKIVEQIHETGRPIVITQHGKPDVVILDANSYEHRLKVANLAELLAEGEADIKAGRTEDYEGFIKEVRSAKKESDLKSRRPPKRM